MRPVSPNTGAPEITLAEEQLEYAPLVCAVYGDNADLGPRTLLSRWRLSDEERNAIAAGADLYISQITFGKGFHPLMLSIGPEPWMGRPKRISVRRDDPGYEAFQQYGPGKIRVLLDGVEQRGVITADENEGFIIRHVRDANGKKVIVGDQVSEETLHGVVKIILPGEDDNGNLR